VFSFLCKKFPPKVYPDIRRTTKNASKYIGELLPQQTNFSSISLYL